MFMNRFFLILWALFVTMSVQAQFVNYGATITIQPGATLRIETSFENQAGTIDNQGTLEVLGNFTNAAGAGTTLSGNGTVKFIGDANSNVTTNGDALQNVEMAKTAQNITLQDPMTINGTLTFTSDNNKIILGSNDLTIGASGSIVSYDDNEYVVTGGTGRLVKTDLGTTAFTYPVGFDASTYNPVTIAENGTVDNIAVRVLQHAYVNGTSGTAITTNIVDATWSITDAVAGGNNLSITPSWIGTDEVSFDRSQCRVVRYNGSKYDLDLATKGAATAPSPYSRQRTGITNIGNFIVSSSSFVKVAPKVFLEGAYVTAEPTNAKMRDALRSNNKLPLAQPFGQLTFTGTYAASLVSDDAVSQTVFDVTGENAVVDWVLLELRDNNTRSIVHARRAALLQRDGDVVDTDGTSPVRFDNITDGNYHLSVRHRVHLGTRTLNSLALSETSTPINFTNNANALANSQKELGSVGSGVFGLFTGDVDRDGRTLSGDILAIGAFINTNLSSFNYFTRSRDCDLDGRILSGDIVLSGTNINKNINLNQ
jgi:hypothetical protein